MTRPATRSRPDIAMLAARVRHQLRRIGPTGCYEGFDYPNLWAEVCHFMRYRPDGRPTLEAFEASVMPVVGAVVDDIPDRHLADLTQSAEWVLGEFGDGYDEAEGRVDKALVERAVWSELCALAAARDISRFVPIGLRDYYF